MKISRSLLVLACLAVVVPVLNGCGGGTEKIVAEQPQSENQKARTREEEVAHFTKMLKNEDAKKVQRAIYWLGEWGPDSTSAIPALEEVASKHKDATLQAAAKEAVTKIQSAKKE